MYELLSGRRAFNSLAELLRDDPPPLTSPVAEIVTRCLSKLPAQRFQTMAELKAALERLSVRPADQQPSIAVLPFANMSRDADDEYFSDGLAEEIINALAHVPGLKVIARTSAFAFKGKHEDIRRIAEALGVANILEGSVRRAGNRVRVTAQLITAADGSHLWSERFDREMSDVFAIQDEIAEAIASALRVKLSAKPHYVPQLSAYEALLRGRFHRQKFTPEAHRRAHECFQQAAALDPGYAAPRAELGLNYLLFATNAVGQMRDVAPRIRAEAQKALELDPAETNAHFLLGAVAATHDYDWSDAAKHFQIAMSSPSVSAETRWAYASFYLAPLGRKTESVAQMRKAVEQDPLNVTWRAILGSHLNSLEMYAQTREELLKALEIDDHWMPNFILCQVYIALGNFAEAVAVGEKSHRANHAHAMPAGVLAAACIRAGEMDRAVEVLREMGDSPTPPWGRVEYHLFCGEIDAAADWYEKSIEQRDPFAVVFASAPIGKDLRHSPRWPRLAKMMNLPEVQ